MIDLHGFALALSQTSQSDEIGALCVEAAYGIEGVDMAGVYRFEPETGDLVLTASRGADEKFLATRLRYAHDAPNAQWVRNSRESFGERMPLPESAHARLRSEGITAFAVIPFRFRGRAYGCLNVASRRLDALSPEIDAALTTLTMMTSEALARAEAEHAMARSDARLRFLFDTMSQGVVYHDAEGTVVDANPAAERILGLTRAQLLGLTSYDPRWHAVREDGRLLHGDEYPASVAIRTGATVRGFVMGVDAGSGERRWLTVDAYPQRDAGAPNHGWVHTVFTDITESRAARATLEAHEAQLDALLRATLDGFVAVSDEGTILDANESYARLLGQTPETLRGRHISQTEAGRDPAAVQEQLALIAQQGWARFGATLLGARGERIEAEVSAWRVPEQGMHLAFVRDLRALRSSEDQLRQAQKMEAVGRLAGGIAHDFNNLLTVINTTCELCLGTLLPNDPLAEDLRQIQDAGERAGRLTRQLLTFSRRHVVQPRRVDVHAVVGEMGRLLRRLIGEDIAVKLHLGSASPQVFIDPGQLEQVVVNLAVNARDAMPAGGELIVETTDLTLDARAAEAWALPTGRYVALAVADTGCGMPPEVLEHVFEPFFTTKGERGTGLGLSTVYGVVRQAAGAIRVTSTPGEGARFEMLLPHCEADAAADAPAAATKARAKVGETVLVVEDERGVRQIVRSVLSGNGYKVLVASGGEEALAICAGYAGGIDLVITDVVMPRMSGREFVERLHAARPGLKVLYFSGYPDEILSREGVLQQGVRLLRKPFALAELQRRVREIIDERPTERPPMAHGAHSAARPDDTRGAPS